MIHPRTAYATGSRGQLAYQVIGDGPVDVIVAGGFPWPMDIAWEQPGYARMLERLAAYGRVIVFDRLGVGLSDPAPAEDSPEARSDDLLVVMTAAGSRSARFLAFGEGALTVIGLAARRPAVVHAVVLVAAYARLVRTEDYPIGVDDSAVHRAADLARRTWGTGEWVISTLFPPYRDDPLFVEWAAKMERYATTADGAAIEWLRIATFDVRHLLDGVEAPALIVTRTDDPGHGSGHGEFLAARLRNGRVLELPGDVVGTFFAAEPDEADEIQEFLVGARIDPAPSRELAAILFTDIVRSTERVAASGDRKWSDLLDHHDSVTQHEVERFGGRVVKTTGDGVVAVFRSPTNAVRCASSVQATLRQSAIETTAGIHVGEIELRGDDIAGLAVHIAQRVSSFAGADEVIVSRTVTELLAGSMPVEAVGVKTLKGVPGDWPLFRVLEADQSRKQRNS